MKSFLLSILIPFILVSCSNKEIGEKQSTSNVGIDSIMPDTSRSRHTVDTIRKRELKITVEMNDIDLIYALTCYKEKPVTKADGLISRLLKLEIKDSIQVGYDVEQLASTQTPEAYCFLFVCSCQFYFVKHTTPFQATVGLIRKYGKPYEVINKYFLPNPVPTNLPSAEFDNRVRAACGEHLPDCYYKD